MSQLPWHGGCNALRRGPLVALALALGLAVTAASAQTVLSGPQIISKLKAKPALDDDDEGGLPTKALGQRPDPLTRLCEARPPGRGGTAGASDNAFRNLVVRPAPKVDLSVEFDFGKATLRPEGAAQLDSLAVALNEPSFADNQFVLTGHTDAVGTADANDRLSCERALSTKRYLVERHRIDAQRLILMGMGFSQPVNRADPRAAANRRVEVKLMPGS